MLNNHELQYLARIVQVQADIEGMKAENTHREQCGESIAYGEDAFLKCRQELESIIAALRNIA